MAGGKPALYDSGVDVQGVMNNLPSGYMKSIQPDPEGFGTLMQNFAAGNTSVSGFASLLW
jgi:hypothetical protein